MSTVAQGSTLYVGKLHSHFVSAQALDEAQVRQWHEAFAEQDPADLVGRMVSDEEWLLIRRLPLKLRWRPDSPATDVGRAWMQGLQRAIEQAADEADEHNMLRYRVWRHGLADMLYRSALGETRQQWAWQCMGLLTRAGVAASQALQQGAAALLAQPDLIWPVLHHCLHAEDDTGAFTALSRRVPASTWRQWLGAAPQTREWMRAMADAHDPARAVALGDALHNEGMDAAHTRDDAMPAQGQALQDLLKWAHRHPTLAQGIGDALSAWMAALAWPSSTRPGEGAASKLRLARSWWAPESARSGAAGLRASARALPSEPGRATSRPSLVRSSLPPPDVDVVKARDDDGHGRERGHDDGRDLQAPAMATQASPADLPVAPALPDPDTTRITAYAGALFWLRHLQLPGVMGDLHARSGLDLDEASAVPLLMQAVAMALNVPVDDPVMSVMTAGRALQPLPAALQTAAATLVAQWARSLDDALPDAPAPRLTWVCQRPGRLKIEPGWIELHLDMDQIDTRIRRIGLDLDPGWVPFLGAVVRIRYA